MKLNGGLLATFIAVFVAGLAWALGNRASGRVPFL
jgi:hypothetical protein